MALGGKTPFLYPDIGAPLYDTHIPPEHHVNNSPVTNCLKETVGVENNVVDIIRDGRY